MTKVSSKKGYIIIKVERGKHGIVQPFKYDDELKYESISGFGEIYSRRSYAERIAGELNSAWSKAKFYVAKGELKLIK